MGSDGIRDNQPSQTHQATDQAANDILKSPKFAPMQTKLASLTGSPSSQKTQLIDFATQGINDAVPKQVSSLTSTPNVAFSIQNKLGLKTSLPRPQFMKRMAK